MIILDPEGLARNFWAGTDWSHTFPRPIERAAPLQLPLVIIKQPQTNVAAVKHWLQQRGFSISLPNDQHHLYGCLVAYGGHGFIFVSEAETPARTAPHGCP